MSQIKTINLTVRVPEYVVTSLENYLKEEFALVDFRIVPDTDDLYNNNATFRRLVKSVKIAKEARDKFINENN